MRVSFSLVATAALAASACNQTAPEVTNNSSAAAEANAAVAASPADPAALAALLPPYPGGQQVRGEAVGGSLAFQTADPPRQVAAFYADIARREGFTVDTPDNNGMLVNMVATREGGGLVNLTATRVGGVTQVQIMAAAGAR